MAAGCYSDHILVSRAYDQWVESRKKGTDAVYVRESFLHRGTLTMMEGLSLSLYLPLSRPLSHSLTLSLSLPPSFPPSLPPSLPLSLSLPLSPSPSLPLSLSLSPSPSLPPSLSPSLPHLTGLRKQFSSHLVELGLKEFDHYNEFSSSEPMIRAVLTAGLDRSVMKMAKMLESGGHRNNASQTVRKRVRTGFKTM